MLESFFWIGIFLLSLTVLVKASDYFTDSAERIGLFFRLPAFIVGVTIVAVGTSLPEMISSIFGVLDGSSEIAIGNVSGSNITNIFLILGVAAIAARKIKLSYDIINIDLPILMGSAFLVTAMAYDGEFSRLESILCLVGLGFYFLRAINSRKEMGKEEKKREKKLEKDLIKEEKLFGLSFKKYPVKDFLTLAISGLFIFIAARYVVSATIEISGIFNIGTEVIAATMIALGTSLPELAISITAARKGKAEIAVGSVLGSNIFNALGVLGVAGLFGTIVVPASILSFGLPVMIIATVLYLFITQDKEITRWEGSFLVVFYVFYIGKLFGWL